MEANAGGEEASEELKACLFCGKEVATMSSRDGYGVICSECYLKMRPWIQWKRAPFLNKTME